MRPSPKVMLVDDDALVLQQVGDALYAKGHTVQLCQYPTLTLPTAQSFKPDVLVLDLSMPVLNGYEVARSMRCLKELSSMRVVFLTGRTQPKEDLHALFAGADDVWHKPFNAESHIARLQQLLEDGMKPEAARGRTDSERLRSRVLGYYRREQLSGVVSVNPGTPFEGRATLNRGELTHARLGPLEGVAALDEMLALEDGVWRFELSEHTHQTTISPPALAVTPESYKPHILLVDDDDALRRLALTLLKREQYEVVEAADGDEGHRKALNHDFDVVVADLNMPVLDGWGLLRTLKADARMREIPVLFLSAHDDYRETLRAARAGAHDYIAKTGHKDELLSHVRRLVSPRMATYDLLRQREAIGDLELSVVGPAWLLRILGELEASYTVHARDDWGRYSLAVQRGRLTKASASSGPRSASGALALVSFVVSRGARAVLAPIEGQALDERPLVLDALNEALAQVGQLERRVVDEQLSASSQVLVDADLYELYLKLASNRDANIARALCESKVPIAELASHLKLPPAETQASVIEMLRRGVITLQ